VQTPLYPSSHTTPHHTTPPRINRHGDADGIVRYSWGKHSAERLKELGVDRYRFETYAGLDHGATPEELAAVVEFIQGLLE
jgi:predicted esterase